jgi:outer membrane protein
MLKRTTPAVITALLLIAGAAQAQQQPDGNWLVRARAMYIIPEHDSEANPVAGLPANALTLNTKTAPEADITYFFTKNIAAELVLTYPQLRRVDLAGTGKIGTFKLLPPTLSVQYHFMPDAKFRPYMGVGVTYARFSSVNILNGALTLDRDHWGPTFQVGFDVPVTKAISVNVDVKKMSVESDVIVAASGAKFSRVEPNPLAVSLGVGWRF